MTPSELREMTDAELMEALAEAKAEKFNLRFQLATNQLDNHARIKDVKQDIARILTVLREREPASVDAGAGTEERA
ncbi:MAG: 50S ribosomal protein L29 [Acidimicrobiia bacterium]